MHRIAGNDFPASLLTLFDRRIPDGPIVFATLARKVPGFAFVDHPVKPTWALLKQAGCANMFIAGAPSVEIVAQVVEAAESGLVLWGHDDEYRSCVPGGRVIRRVEFSGRLSGMDRFEALLHRVPEGCEIRPLDRALVPRSLWRDGYVASCGSMDDFLRHGAGFCMIRNESVVSEAFAPWIADNRAELGATTHEAFRGRGYAAIVAAHLIRSCEDRGLETVWSCDAHHEASVAVARKLGFSERRDYQHIWHPKYLA